MSSGPTIIAGMGSGDRTVIAGQVPGGGPTVPGGRPPRPSAEEEDGPLSRPKPQRERLEFALPTINIIFLLMLYFVVAGTIVQNDELSVTPPVTSETPTDRLPRPLLVVNDSGALMLDGRPLTRDELLAAAADAVSRSQSQQLNVLAPAEMAAPPFLELINAFASANIPVRVVMIDKNSVRTVAAPRTASP
jgi:biopolymer transport protein ExbD